MSDMTCQCTTDSRSKTPAGPVSGNTPHGTHGVLVIDKPEGITSFGLVARIKKLLRIKKVGHCGTLDPFATGVMLVCLNQATRIVDHLLGQDKVYRFILRAGMETDTLDRTGQVVQTYDGPPRSEEDLKEALECFRGPYLQQVPKFAAVKVQGRRLYELSRKGIEVEQPTREVHIHRLELISYCWPEAVLEAHCSKGTYIRQLACDIGRRLGCGAHVSELRRLASGPFTEDQAVSFDALQVEQAGNDWRSSLISMSEALSHLPAVRIEDEWILKRLHDGILDSHWETEHRRRFAGRGTPVRLLAGDDCLIALWWPHPESGQQRRLRVFSTRG